MSEFGDKLTEALSKKTNVEDFIWKGKKENGQQIEYKLIDFDQQTLQEKYDLCEQMLYNTNTKHPGRLVLLDIVSDQILRCRAELLVRWLRSYHDYSNNMLLESLKTLIANNRDILTQETMKTIPICKVMGGIEDLDLRRVPFSLVLDACMDHLGALDTSHLTFNFIVRMGLWFTQQEMQTPVEDGGLYQRDPATGKAVNRLELIKTVRRLNPAINLRIDPTGLSYAEFKSMCDLNRDKYSNLTTNQLKLLSSKILYRFQDQCQAQADQWFSKIREIEFIAKHKGYNLVSQYPEYHK